MTTEVTLASAGTIGDLKSGWSVNEEATPVAIGDSSGAIDSASLVVRQGTDSEFAIADPVTVEHDQLGTFSGFIASLTSNGATEDTDTTLSMSAMGTSTTLTTEKTSRVIPGPRNMVQAGRVPDASAPSYYPSNTGVYANLIATGPANDGNIYRLENTSSAPITGDPTGPPQVAYWGHDGVKHVVQLSGTGPMLNITGFEVTPTLFVVFYISSGVKKLGFFNKTTGAMTASIGSAGSGPGQFATSSTGIHYDSTNNLVYVADTYYNRVQVFQTDATFYFQFTVTSPDDITGTANAIYVSENIVPQTVREYTLSGLPTGKVFTAGYPGTIAISPDGRALVTAYGSNLALWDLHTTALLSRETVYGTKSIYSIATTSNFVYVAAFYAGGGRDIEMVVIGQISLYAAFAYYAALGQVPYISYQANFNRLIDAPAWTDTPWNKIKELAAAYDLEVAMVDGVLTVRNTGTKVLSLDNVVGGSVSLGASILQSAKAVNIEYGNAASYSYGTFYKSLPGEIISLQAGEIRYDTITTDSQLSAADQPIFDINYAVVDTEGVRVTARQWAESGASISYTLDPKLPNSVQMLLVGPKIAIPGTNGNFQIGVADPNSKTTLITTNYVKNPGGYSGTGWSIGTNLTVTYSSTLSPVWRHTAGTSGNASIVIPVAPLTGGKTYRISLSLRMTAGSASGFGVYQAGSLPFATLGSMTLSGTTWSWTGDVYVPSNSATPNILIDVQGTGAGEYFTLGDLVMVEELDLTSPYSSAPFFDGSTPYGRGGNFTYAWNGTPYASSSTKSLVEAPYARFFIRGNGIFMSPETATLLTGADPVKTSNELAADIRNPFIQTVAQAYDRGVWRAEQLAGPQLQLSATVPTSELEGFGLTAGSIVSFKESKYRVNSVTIGAASSSITATKYVKVSDVIAVNGGRTVGQLDTFWAGTKYKDKVIKPLRDAPDLYPYGAVGGRYYATADSFGQASQGSVVGYITLLKNELGFTPYTNVSVGSRCAQDGAQEAWGNVLPVPYNLGPDAFAHIAFGMNPALQQGTNPLTRAAEKGALEQLIWAMCAESKLSNDAWTKVGPSWGVYSNAGLKDGNAYVAEAAGHYATMTPPAGSYIGIGYSFSTAGSGAIAGTGTWKRGSVTLQNNDASMPPATAWGNLLVPHPVRFIGMNGGTQIRVDSAAAQYTTLDSLVKLSATPPWIVIVKPTYTKAPASLPRATTDAYRADIDSVVESVGAAYPPLAKKLIVVDPVAVGWNPEIHVDTDGIHPSDLGARFLADCVKKAIAFAMAYPSAESPGPLPT